MYKRVVLNFIKLVTKNGFDNRLNNYEVLLSFLKNFDNNINLTRSNFNNYRSRDTKLHPFITTKRTEDFVKYIKQYNSDFNADMINIIRKNDKKSIPNSIYKAPYKRDYQTSILRPDHTPKSLITNSYNNSTRSSLQGFNKFDKTFIHSIATQRILIKPGKIYKGSNKNSL